MVQHPVELRFDGVQLAVDGAQLALHLDHRRPSLVHARLECGQLVQHRVHHPRSLVNGVALPQVQVLQALIHLGKLVSEHLGEFTGLGAWRPSCGGDVAACQVFRGPAGSMIRRTQSENAKGGSLEPWKRARRALLPVSTRSIL